MLKARQMEKMLWARCVCGFVAYGAEELQRNGYFSRGRCPRCNRVL